MVPLFAMQYKRQSLITKERQRPADRGIAHAKQLGDAPNCRKRTAGIARLLEQAQANAERSGSQNPAQLTSRGTNV